MVQNMGCISNNIWDGSHDHTSSSRFKDVITCICKKKFASTLVSSLQFLIHNHSRTLDLYGSLVLCDFRIECINKSDSAGQYRTLIAGRLSFIELINIHYPKKEKKNQRMLYESEINPDISLEQR